MHERRRVDLLLDGVENQWLGGVKSNILCQPQLYNDFNATANHLKDCINRMPELQASGRQLGAVAEDVATTLTRPTSLKTLTSFPTNPLLTKSRPPLPADTSLRTESV